MRTGNVIRDPQGDLWIVAEVHDDGPNPHVEAICFDSENVSAVQRLDDHDRNESCGCEQYGANGEYDGHAEDCTDCHGTGRYVKHIKGWKHSKVLASNVQEFIMKGVKKGFGLQ